MSDDGDFGPMPSSSLPGALEETLSQNAPHLRGEEAILTGYVVVAEWATTAGNRWLSRTHNPGMTGWAMRGILHEALYEWPDPDDGE